MKRMLLMALACSVLLMGATAGAESEVEIRGTITNMKAAAAYIKPESYLQLVRLPADNQLAGTYEHGSIIYRSNLAGTTIPKSGKFKITALGLAQGRYVIAGQALAPYGLGRGGTQMLAKKGSKKILIINIKAGKKRKVINLGALYLPIPK